MKPALSLFLSIALGLTLTTLPSHAGPPAIGALSNPLPWLMAKIESTASPHLYGTAILFDVTETEYLFLTNAHVLPKQMEALAQVRLLSPVRNYQAAAISVKGISAGHDLAVLSVRRTANDVAEPRLGELARSAFSTENLAGRRLRTGLLGFPGMHQLASELRPGLKTDLWFPAYADTCLERVAAQSEAYARARAIPGSVTGRVIPGDGPDLPFPTTPENPFALSPVTTILGREICPTPLAMRCYESRIWSSGFSGGAFVVAAAGAVAPSGIRIAGIISHFSPLSEVTYIIPSDIALAVARRLIAGPPGDDDLFEVVDGGVLIRGGALAGRHVRAARGSLLGSPGGHDSGGGGGDTSPGGHDSGGGGGETSPGGHDSGGGGGDTQPGGHDSGGGGDPRLPSLVIASRDGNVALMGVYSAIGDAATRPAEWARPGNALGRVLGWMPSFKGIGAHLAFRPGVEIGRRGAPDSYRRYYMADGQPLYTAQQFISSYRTRPRLTLADSFPALELPARLSLDPSVRIGMRAYGDIRRFRTGAEIRELPVGSRNDTGFSFREVGDLMRLHGASRDRLDLVIAQAGANLHAPITRASLTRSGGTATVTMQDSYYGAIQLIFPDRFAQIGPRFHQYAGEVRLTLPARSWDAVRTVYEGPAFAVVTVQWLPEDGIYELKIVVAHVTPSERIGSASVLTREAIAIDGLYAPLTDP